MEARRKMKKLWIVSLALAAALAISPAAKADSFTFTLSGTGLSGTGVVTGSGSGGVFSLTGGTVVVNGIAGSLIPVAATTSGTVHITVNGSGVATYYYNWPNTGEKFTFDNKLTFPGTPHTDSNGLAFSLPGGALLDFWYDTSAGSYYYNIFDGTADGAYYGWKFDPESATGGAPADIEFGATPEPSSLLLLGTGLLFMAGFLFRKAKPGMVPSI